MYDCCKHTLRKKGQEIEGWFRFQWAFVVWTLRIALQSVRTTSSSSSSRFHLAKYIKSTGIALCAEDTWTASGSHYMFKSSLSSKTDSKEMELKEVCEKHYLRNFPTYVVNKTWHSWILMVCIFSVVLAQHKAQRPKFNPLTSNNTIKTTLITKLHQFTWSYNPYM